ncbi:MAG: lipocalin family protein [Opitutaceae bacterium]|nr:lipocalin family protein [Opitutaceae bacterium]
MKTRLLITLKLSIALAAALIMSACVKPGPARRGGDFAGEYRLVSVNGEPVPANITHGGAGLQIRSGTFTIRADGTCSTKTVFVPQSGTDVAREVSATFAVDGSKLTMRWKGAGTTVGTIEGNTFTMHNEGMAFVYSR